MDGQIDIETANTNASGSFEPFEDLRKRNERRARIARLLAAQRERRQLAIERVLRLQREHRRRSG
jgi:hypothetical protein